MTESSDDDSSVFCGADLGDRFARHAQCALEAEQYADPAMTDAILVHSAEIERFFHAVETNNKSLVQEIIAANPSIVNSRSPARHKSTALHVAAENEMNELVSVLIGANANANISNEYGLTPIALCRAESQAFELISQVTELKENGRRDAVLRGGDAFSRF